jgi:REP element-mobilizing transposase RayT
MSEFYQSLSHSKWDCKDHVVFVPKGRRKVIFGQTRRQLGPIFHALARQKGCQILEGHLMPDHVHMCIAIPPKHPVASVIGFLKGKSAIAIAGQQVNANFGAFTAAAPGRVLSLALRFPAARALSKGRGTDYPTRGLAFSESRPRSARLSRLKSRLAARIGRPTDQN